MTTELIKMTETLRQHGAWAHGPEEPETVAAFWIGEGVCTEEEMDDWLEAGVFDTAAAGDLRRAGVAPADLAGVAPADVEGRLGYAFANGDLSLEKVLAHLGR